MAFSKFLYDNNLKQVDICRFLDISRPYCSQLTHGTAKLSSENLVKLLNNQEGWDVSALLDRPADTSISATANNNSTATISLSGERMEMNRKLNEAKAQIALLNEARSNLEARLKASEEKCDQFWQLIQKLTK